ncbi:MAG: hypothetical protein P4M12_02195 [Gammaproteobacteria bacterium]|nr:hypothetical protein [Gammaproteobacteria bacterium]
MTPARRILTPAPLDHLIKNNNDKESKNKKLSDYITKIAKLGGYLARALDPPPGNIVMWRGLSD